ncbi:MAG: hypothetical protein IT469_01805 [Pseudomonadales bacterium]|nr:hypothetical protein [Pseudomonadales bacterium]
MIHTAPPAPSAATPGLYCPETRLLAELPRHVPRNNPVARRLVERGYARWMNIRPGSRFYRGLLPTPEGRAVVRELAAIVGAVGCRISDVPVSARAGRDSVVGTTIGPSPERHAPTKGDRR